MIALGFSHVTSVANGSGASSRVQPSSNSSRFWSSKRPVALVAAPRPRRRSAGRMRSAIASGRWRGSTAKVRLRLGFIGMFRNVRKGTNHEHEIGPHQRRVKAAQAGAPGTIPNDSVPSIRRQIRWRTQTRAQSGGFRTTPVRGRLSCVNDLRPRRCNFQRAGQFENVSQSLMSPLFKPAVSHFCRIAEEPWVKLSGTA